MSLGDRMKSYEGVSNFVLTPKIPVIIRIDGKSFSSWTSSFEKPFDPKIQNAFREVSHKLSKEISGALMFYCQSDEISILLQDWKRAETQPWFNYKVQKITSISASMATVAFNSAIQHENGKPAIFDSRAFNLPISEVVNYFIWRQRDCIRNATSQLARKYYSQKELNGKSSPEQLALLEQKGVYLKDYPVSFQQGFTLIRSENGWEEDFNLPLFQSKREYIENLLE